MYWIASARQVIRNSTRDGSLLSRISFSLSPFETKKIILLSVVLTPLSNDSLTTFTCKSGKQLSECIHHRQRRVLFPIDPLRESAVRSITLGHIGKISTRWNNSLWFIQKLSSIYDVRLSERHSWLTIETSRLKWLLGRGERICPWLTSVLTDISTILTFGACC